MTSNQPSRTSRHDSVERITEPYLRVPPELRGLTVCADASEPEIEVSAEDVLEIVDAANTTRREQSARASARGGAIVSRIAPAAPVEADDHYVDLASEIALELEIEERYS